MIFQDNETHNLSTVDYGCMFNLMVNDMVTFLLFKVKAAVEKKVGKKLETYSPVSYKTQVVAGTNYFVKVLVYYLFSIKNKMKSMYYYGKVVNVLLSSLHWFFD